MEISEKFEWTVGELPFFWGALRQPTNGDLPDRLAFGLYVDARTGVLTQSPNGEVSAALEEAYKKGSEISGMMDPSGIGRKYADDFIAAIQKTILPESIAGKKILEIGCGTGYLLSCLKQLGATVIGIEPGEHGREGSKKYGVPIVHDFFPSKHVVDTFDIILIYGVLEHIEKPLKFLSDIGHQLKKNGHLILSVPDCQPYLQKGDISLLLHEHWSYFTKDTLKSLMVNNGFHDVAVVNSEFGGALYAVGKAGVGSSLKETIDIKNCIQGSERFRELSAISGKKLTKYFLDARKNNKTVGVFVPGRIVNALVSNSIPLDGCRFIDDNASFNGMFFPGIDIPIESMQSLVNYPTDQVLVMSRTFEEKIKQQLNASLPRIKITTWSQIFSE